MGAKGPETGTDPWKAAGLYHEYLQMASGKLWLPKFLDGLCLLRSCKGADCRPLFKLEARQSDQAEKYIGGTST